MTSIHMNNTTKKTPCQPQYVHSLGMLTAENVILPQLLDFGLRTRSKWDLRFFGDFTQRRLVVSCRHFGTTVVVKFSQQCWWRRKSSGTFRPVD